LKLQKSIQNEKTSENVDENFLRFLARLAEIISNPTANELC
jgi:hypothetical protein